MTYSDARKLLFVVADGMITGAGEKMGTPNICVGLLDADPRFGNPTSMSYLSIGSGTKWFMQDTTVGLHFFVRHLVLRNIGSSHWSPYTHCHRRRLPVTRSLETAASETADELFLPVSHNNSMTPL